MTTVVYLQSPVKTAATLHGVFCTKSGGSWGPFKGPQVLSWVPWAGQLFPLHELRPLGCFSGEKGSSWQWKWKDLSQRTPDCLQAWLLSASSSSHAGPHRGPRKHPWSSALHVELPEPHETLLPFYPYLNVFKTKLNITVSLKSLIFLPITPSSGI